MTGACGGTAGRASTGPTGGGTSTWDGGSFGDGRFDSLIAGVSVCGVFAGAGEMSAGDGSGLGFSWLGAFSFRDCGATELLLVWDGSACPFSDFSF